MAQHLRSASRAYKCSMRLLSCIRMIVRCDTMFCTCHMMVKIATCSSFGTTITICYNCIYSEMNVFGIKIIPCFSMHLCENHIMLLSKFFELLNFYFLPLRLDQLYFWSPECCILFTKSMGSNF